MIHIIRHNPTDSSILQKDSFKISPTIIKYRCLPAEWQKLGLSRYDCDGFRLVGQVVPGDWDMVVEAYENCWVYKSFKDVYVGKKKWEETLYPAQFCAKVSWNETFHGYKSWSKFRELYLGAKIKQIYKDFKAGKIVKQKEIHTEIEVAIGRAGEIIFVDGRHRMALARLLGLPYVYVVVDFIHQEWLSGNADACSVDELLRRAVG